MKRAGQTEASFVVAIERLASDAPIRKRPKETLRVSRMRTHAPYSKLGTPSRPNASPRDPHIDVLRSCTRGEPIATVANTREVVR